jgi:endoglucanase
LALLAMAIAGCASTGTRHPGGDVLAARPLFVNPDTAAAQQAREWVGEGRLREAKEMQRIASQPTAVWFTGTGDVRSQVTALTLRATRAGDDALLVAYDIPARDCGGYSAGGAGSPAQYRQWIDQFAAGIGNRYATVILEPDAVPEILSHCLSSAGASQREQLLRYASLVLKAKAHVSVYLDAGNPGWVTQPGRLVGPLRKSGLDLLNGFSLNVANFYSDAQSISYGERLAQALGGHTHFVIDSSRNGNGPYRSSGGGPDWCNPPGRALGIPPSTDTHVPLLDAYLWVKQPGTSDGSCRPGEPHAGEWWPQYALGLLRG